MGLDAAADEGVFDVGGDVGALALDLEFAGDGGQVGLFLGGVDVAVQLGALSDESESLARRRSRSPLRSLGKGVSANTSRTVSCQYVPNSGGLQFA